ncbi:hypothetical protein A0H81_03827 [Grifola frondosa]|uniref:Uncharacterized protein n=1 Tax=Grifola frondosa TaxID=5627 RepID=A0A1C7MKV1_GRIFR|nr:hypothetical protein A0H81_03827 [Grifola frondosa]
MISTKTNRIVCFVFEVSKTNEQDENVTIATGFTIEDTLIATADVLNECSVDVAQMRPRLVAGEARQGIMTTAYVPASRQRRTLRESSNPVRLNQIISEESIELGEKFRQPP